MPELPEVETVKNILINELINKEIKDVIIYRDKTIEGNVNDFILSVKNKKILDITRKGKFLIFHLSDDVIFLSHLRMEGKYFYYDNLDSSSKYPMVKFIFKDNTSLIYDDMRKFGTMILKNKNNYLSSAPLNNLGLEPFDFKEIDIKNLHKKLSKSNHPIKSLIMDQNNIAGLGNIYADEVLFLSKIHPLTKGKDISLTMLKDIINNSIIILNKAIKLGGSTIKSYHPSEGVDGLFATKLNVYGKKDEPCPICKERLIKTFVNGRGTTYCPRCQIDYSKPYTVGLTGKIGSGKSTFASLMKEKGYLYLDSDQIVHELYLDKKIQNKIIKLLKLDSFSVSNIKNQIFKDNKYKKILEDYIHPLVKNKIFDFIYSKDKKDKLIIEVPLLFESNLDFIFDDIVYLDINKENQIRNLKNRNADVTESIKLNNLNHENNKKKSSIIINNDDDISSLKNKIDKLFK